MEPRKWYAVYTKPRWEKKIADHLTRKEIINYCPINRVVKQWKDRKKMIHEPLFKSYVFVQVNRKQMNEVLETFGVVRFVSFLNQPTQIPDREILAIREFLGEHVNVRLESLPIAVQDPVRITRGPLAQYEGRILQVGSRKLRVSLPSLGYMMTVEIDREHVIRLNEIV